MSTKFMTYLKKYRLIFLFLGLVLLSFAVNFYLQLCQNGFSWRLAYKFAFSWHTIKFLLSSGILLIVLIFLISLCGSYAMGCLCYVIFFGLLGYADYLKMYYRSEPIYPEDLKMITQWSLLKEMGGSVLFYLALGLSILGIAAFLYTCYRSLFFNKKQQRIRLSVLVVSTLCLMYIGQFNQEGNLVKKAYDPTALWIPYSQKMNYYNTGFVAGFLYNLDVQAMNEPSGYSEKAIKALTQKYNQLAREANVNNEKPNIIYIMSESFSDPLRLEGMSIDNDPLSEYRMIAQESSNGQMLSQGYGGGTANIEFEALTSFSMEPLQAQMTTPYTMLIPKKEKIPSVVSFLKGQNYQTTAIHPYNTSMYKRKDVYQRLGFDQFLYEETMKHKDMIENNPYISDEAAFEEVLDILKKNQNPQFIHLVTMQTHMPYATKYKQSKYHAEVSEKRSSVNNYLQDIAYTSQAFARFCEELKQLPEPTIVVFWGDHLPGIYPDDLIDKNDEHLLHETEYLFFNNQKNLNGVDHKPKNPLSPIYFTPSLLAMNGLPRSGFYQFLLALEPKLPAFEKGSYWINGQWQKTRSLSPEDKELYHQYQLLQYDILVGKQYSLQENFYQHLSKE